MIQKNVPRAGDAVILTGDYAGALPGSIGIIGGAFSGENLSITFNARAFRAEGYVSCGGGPASFSLPELHPTKHRVTATFWRWKDGIAMANNGEDFQLEVPLWEYKGTEKAHWWTEEECTVDRLLGDRQKLTKVREMMLFPEGYDVGAVFRGDQPLTNIPNRPDGDYIGRRILDAYYRRQVLHLTCHEEHAVGAGYYFTVQLDGYGFIAFRTEDELNAWMKAYNLKQEPNPYSFKPTNTVILPNADVDSWQPLRHLAIAA